MSASLACHILRDLNFEKFQRLSLICTPESISYLKNKGLAFMRH